MRVLKKIQEFITALITISILVSCHAIEKAALSCPEISNPHYRSAYHELNLNKLNLKQKIKPSPKLTYVIHGRTTNPTKILGVSKADFQKKLEASVTRTFVPQQVNCDTIFLRSGSWMNVKVLRTGLLKIRYSSCLPETASKSYIAIREVRSVKYANGDTKYFGAGNDNIQPANNIPKINEPFGVFGFISSLMILLFRHSPANLYFLFTGFVLGGISYFKIRRHPDKFKGKALAVFSTVLVLVIAVIVIIAVLIALGINASNTNL